MDNKLSELNKPVAEIKCNEYLSLSVVNVRYGFTLGRHPVYSQEYVSALLAELEAKDKRIAELEEEFAFIMGQNDGMEKELRDKDARIEHLEAKLATPVRSPDDGLEDCQKMFPLNCDNDFDTGYNFGIYRYEQNIRAAGFKVEGDE